MSRITDGVEVVDCPDCKASGDTYCPTCGQADGSCERCDGSGEVPASSIVEDDNDE